MSRLSIETPGRAETVVEGLYRDVERRISASPPGLCPVDMALSFLRLSHAQTCGKCVPCRIGLGQLTELLESVLDSTATPETIDLIEKTARVIQDTADCAIGYEAARMVLQGVQGFRDDYMSHVEHGRCLFGWDHPVPCVALCPAGVDIPGYIALVRAGRYNDAVRLIRKDNPFPTVCGYVCEHPCEARCRRSMVDDAVNICGIKRFACDHADNTTPPDSAPSTGKRIGIIPAFMEAEGLTAEVRRAVEKAATELEAQGAQLVEVDLPHLDAAIAAYYVIGPAEAFSNLARFDGVRYGFQEEGCSNLADQSSRSRARGFGMEAKRRQMLGAYLLSSGVYDKYYYAAQKARTLITRDYAAAFEKVDAILMPAAPRTAFKHGEISDPTQMYLSDLYTISLNIAGNGGVSVPLGLGEDFGLPVSAQLVAPAFSDRKLLTIARALELAFGSSPVAPDFAGKGGELA